MRKQKPYIDTFFLEIKMKMLFAALALLLSVNSFAETREHKVCRQSAEMVSILHPGMRDGSINEHVLIGIIEEAQKSEDVDRVRVIYISITMAARWQHRETIPENAISCDSFN